MDIEGIVTRLVEADPQRGLPPRIFIRPTDPTVYRQLDGSQFCASGEIPIPVTGETQHQVGDEDVFTLP